MQWIIANIAASVAFGIPGARGQRTALNSSCTHIAAAMTGYLKPVWAGLVYSACLAGVLWFTTKPGLAGGSKAAAVLNVALPCGLCLATYFLTRQTVLKHWSIIEKSPPSRAAFVRLQPRPASHYGLPCASPEFFLFPSLRNLQKEPA